MTTILPTGSESEAIDRDGSNIDSLNDIVTLEYADLFSSKRSRSRFWVGLQLTIVTFCTAVLAYGWLELQSRRCCSARADLAKAAIRPNGSISQAIKMFHLNCGRYPVKLTELIERPKYVADTWQGPYLEDAGALVDPWGKPFSYRSPTLKSDRGYDLWSAGKNGKFGDGDDICSW